MANQIHSIKLRQFVFRIIEREQNSPGKADYIYHRIVNCAMWVYDTDTNAEFAR